jgi:hypothetical protein
MKRTLFIKNKIRTYCLKKDTLKLEYVALEDEKILCNNVTFPHEKGARLYAVGNEYGPLGAVWAHCDQEALSEAVDQDLGNAFVVSEKDATEDCRRVGNSGKLCNLEHAWAAEVELDPVWDFKLFLEFAEAKGEGRKTISKNKYFVPLH